MLQLFLVILGHPDIKIILVSRKQLPEIGAWKAQGIKGAVSHSLPQASPLVHMVDSPGIGNVYSPAAVRCHGGPHVKIW